MASGCIMGNCPYCDELVWEDGHTLDSYDRVCCIGCRRKSDKKMATDLKLKVMREALEKLSSISIIATEAIFKVKEIDGEI